MKNTQSKNSQYNIKDEVLYIQKFMIQYNIRTSLFNS